MPPTDASDLVVDLVVDDDDLERRSPFRSDGH
jgi:hypothetical protein